MKHLTQLMKQNRRWAERVNKKNPDFFAQLSKQQSPEYLWIGCSDSRVPANEILGLLPGDVFVHRNVANVIVHSDLNFLSVLQYAVDVLKVKHILVCGHYGCGGVKAAIENASHGLIDNWLRHVQDVAVKHEDFVSQCLDQAPAEQKHGIMCELNAVEQVENVVRTTVIQDAWKRGQSVMIHAVVYGLSDGHLKQIAFGVESNEELKSFKTKAFEQIEQDAGNLKY